LMSGPGPMALPRAGEVHVWWIPLDLIPGDALAILSPDERARADRFRRPVDRARWIAARAALRQILSGYTRSSPDRLRFARTVGHAARGTRFPREISPSPLAPGEGDWGVRADRWIKPALAGGSPLRFSLTHAGDRAALAVAWEREVGIDLEPIDAALDLPPLMAVACTTAESARLDALPAAVRVESFVALWTLKEAYLKAIGIGLSRQPRSVEIELLRDGRAAILDPDSALACSLRLLDAGPGWVAALALAGMEPTVREFRWLS
jgi:4'-phosphopantetheinyl transferase